MRKTSATMPSASCAPSRRTRYRCSTVACRSKIVPKHAGVAQEAAMTTASDSSSTAASFPQRAPGSALTLQAGDDRRDAARLEQAFEAFGIGRHGARIAGVELEQQRAVGP